MDASACLNFLTICSGVCNFLFIRVSFLKKPTYFIGYSLINNGTVFGGHATTGNGYNYNVDIDDDGKVTISGVDAKNVDKARDYVCAIVEEAEIGKTYIGKVKRTTDFGAFVEILPGKEGLVHISKLSRQRVKKVTDVVRVGDEITVKVIKIDEQGRINLVRKE